MSIKHRHIVTRVFDAVRFAMGGRAVIVDRALLESIVIIDSRTGEYEIHGDDCQVRRGREGEWIVKPLKLSEA